MLHPTNNLVISQYVEQSFLRTVGLIRLQTVLLMKPPVGLTVTYATNRTTDETTNGLLVSATVDRDAGDRGRTLVDGRVHVVKNKSTGQPRYQNQFYNNYIFVFLAATALSQA